jgi:hypothetical protein
MVSRVAPVKTSAERKRFSPRKLVDWFGQPPKASGRLRTTIRSGCEYKPRVSGSPITSDGDNVLGTSSDGSNRICGMRYGTATSEVTESPDSSRGDLAQGDLWGMQGDDWLALFEEWAPCVAHERGEISVRLWCLGCLECRHSNKQGVDEVGWSRLLGDHRELTWLDPRHSAH